jgi:hypothetical protein
MRMYGVTRFRSYRAMSQGLRERTSPTETEAASIEGGEAYHLSNGEVITIPAKTPHWFKEVPTGTVAC